MREGGGIKMAKQVYKLVEVGTNEELVNAELTEAKIKKLIKLYQASGLKVYLAAWYLTEWKGQTNETIKQYGVR